MRSSRSSFGSAQFRILSDNQIEDLHLATLETMKRTGVRIYSEEGVELLRKAGADASDGNRCRIPSHLVESAIRSAPSSITLYTRDGRPAMHLEDHRSYFGTGPSLPNILDPYTGERRAVVKEDVVNVAKVCDALPNFDFVMSLGIVSDCPLGTADVAEFEAMVLNTNKPVVGWAYELEGYYDILDMALAVRGSLEEIQRYPFFALYSEPTSPFHHSKEAVDKLLFCAARRIPSLYAPTTMQGASAPVTNAGAIVVANTELLTGLVMSQLKQEGAPYIYGGFAVPLDYRTTVMGIASPEALVNSAAIADLAHHYRLPDFSVAGLADSKVFDEQCAIEGTVATMMAGLSGSNLNHDIGYIESGLTASLEMVVAMDEVIGMLKHIMRGIEVNEETIALDLIDEIGPGGHFMATDHTLRHYKENWYPSIFDRWNLSGWEEKGRKTLAQRANEKVRDIIEDYRPQPLPIAVQDRIREITRRAKERAKASS